MSVSIAEGARYARQLRSEDVARRAVASVAREAVQRAFGRIDHLAVVTRAPVDADVIGIDGLPDLEVPS